MTATAKPSVRARVRGLPGGRLAWRIGVTVIGVAVILVGIVLLPLPGPGWLIIFAGLGVLATEYPWAARLLGYGRAQVRRWTEWAQRRSLFVQALLALAGIVLLVAIAWLCWVLL